MDIIDSYGPLFPLPHILSPWISSSIWNYIMSRFSWLPDSLRRDHSYTKKKGEKKQTSFFTPQLLLSIWIYTYFPPFSLFVFLLCRLQVWGLANLEIMFQIRLSNGILVDCWSIPSRMAGWGSGQCTSHVFGRDLETFGRRVASTEYSLVCIRPWELYWEESIADCRVLHLH